MFIFAIFYLKPIFVFKYLKDISKTFKLTKNLTLVLWTLEDITETVYVTDFTTKEDRKIDIERFYGVPYAKSPLGWIKSDDYWKDISPGFEFDARNKSKMTYCPQLVRDPTSAFILGGNPYEGKRTQESYQNYKKNFSLNFQNRSTPDTGLETKFELGY
jgi:hypothetical protein